VIRVTVPFFGIASLLLGDSPPPYGGARGGWDTALLRPGYEVVQPPGRLALRRYTVSHMAIDEGLDRIEAQLQEEGQRVLAAIRGAIRALEERDRELADEVIAFDDEIDRLFLDIESSIQSLLALQTPVARDLRLVLAILHINLLLERTADGCVTIAKLSKLVAEIDPDPALVEVLTEMGERAEEMCRVALDSFAARDLAGAESLVELDEAIDRANRRFVERLVDVMGDPLHREWGLRMVVVARTIERIGDRAVDIGEQTAYLLTAEFREFTDASHPTTTT
jgi:phosphate transport system protein